MFLYLHKYQNYFLIKGYLVTLEINHNQDYETTEENLEGKSLPVQYCPHSPASPKHDKLPQFCQFQHQAWG